MTTQNYFTTVDANELTTHLIGKFTARPENFPYVQNYVERYIWNNCGFSFAVSIHEISLEKFKESKNFIYDKATEMFFINFNHSPHQLLMAYIEALHKFDFSKESHDNEFHDLFTTFNAYSKLADEYIINGHGILLSSVSKKILLGEAFIMTDKENEYLGHFNKTYIN
jgi:hypothetical protein